MKKQGPVKTLYKVNTEDVFNAISTGKLPSLFSEWGSLWCIVALTEEEFKNYPYPICLAVN